MVCESIKAEEWKRLAKVVLQGPSIGFTPTIPTSIREANEKKHLLAVTKRKSHQVKHVFRGPPIRHEPKTITTSTPRNTDVKPGNSKNSGNKLYTDLIKANKKPLSSQTCTRITEEPKITLCNPSTML